MHSIGTRITVGFYALAFLIVGLSAFTFSDLHFLEQHIDQGAAVSSFAEQVSEMRRNEKNFFLYQEQKDLAEGLEHANQALTLLGDHQALFSELCHDRDCATLADQLAAYGALLRSWRAAPDGDIKAFEETLRDTGHRVSSQTQQLRRRERNNLSEAVSDSGRWLLGAVLSVGLLGGLLGPLLARSVVRPLRQLEANLAPIAAGRFHELPVPSKHREFISFAAAFNRMLAELEDRRRQLLHSEKLASLGVLVSGVAHELNNPLSNISTSCQLALEELDSGDREQLQEWLKQIDEQTERARHIVLALSDYARRRPLTVEPVLVNEVLDKTLLLVRKELGTQVTVQREIPTGMAILADAQRLQQVFINVLKNAVDAGGPGVTITLSARRLESGRSPLPAGRYRIGELPPPSDERVYALLSVADDGPGMAREVLERIFDPFFTTHEVGQGMGLGLYIVQEIVQELDGCIAVDSEPGHGTRFEIALPCATQEKTA